METMVAARFSADDRALRLEEVPIPEPGPMEVVVKVEACGICLSDVHLIDGSIPAVRPTVTPGHECFGLVASSGNLVPRWKQGQRVTLAGGKNCGICATCKVGRMDECLAFKIMGFHFDGAWAEYIAVPFHTLSPVPEGIPPEQAAILADAVATPYAALKDRARLQAGESVGLWGIGGLGTHAVQLARMLGAGLVIAVDPLASRARTSACAGSRCCYRPSDPRRSQGDLRADPRAPVGRSGRSRRRERGDQPVRLLSGPGGPRGDGWSLDGTTRARTQRPVRHPGSLRPRPPRLSEASPRRAGAAARRRAPRPLGLHLGRHAADRRGRRRAPSCGERRRPGATDSQAVTSALSQPASEGLFDPFAPKMLADPYPLYARLRAEAPVQRGPEGVWLVLGYDAALAILRDHARFSVEHGAHATSERASPTTIERGLENVMLFKDPPDHTRLRSLVNKAFTPRVVESLRTRIHEIVDSLIDRVESAGEMDVIADFAYPLPVTVIAELLGIPKKDRDGFKRWSRQIAPILDPQMSQETFGRVAEAGLALASYFDGLVTKRRVEPTDDLVSELIRAEDEGERLTEEELRATLILLLVAGHETTMNLIGNGLLALLRHPDQADRLRAEPRLARTAIEELLRYDGPVHLTARTATDDIEIEGVTIAKGEVAMVLLGAADRDPAQFPQPESLDIGREPNRHLAFSAGGHFCVGATLARVEAQIVFEGLLRRLPSLSLAHEDPIYRPTVTLRGLKALPVGF